MRKLILILLLFVSAVVNGQTPAGYIKANMRFKWTAGIFDSALHVPQYNGTPSGIRNGAWVGDGAVAVDTVNNLFYFRSSGAWHSTSSGAGWLLTGNSGTTSSNFIGTTDDQPLSFRVNNRWAGRLTTSGNIFWGDSAGVNNIGYSNVAIGRGALRNDVGGINLVAIGDSALYNNLGDVGAEEGLQNTAVGSKALYSNTTGSYNTANGHQSLYSNTTGYYNTANGLQSLYSNTTGSNNTANGTYSLYSNTTGYSNTANGYYSLYSNTTGYYNSAVGVSALYSNTTGFYNSAVGVSALYSNTTGYYNTANGLQSLYKNTTGFSNIANGYRSLYNNTTGYSNTANGNQSLYSNTTGNSNTVNGYYSLFSNTTGDSNTANGANSLPFNTTGSNNTANGTYSLYSNTTGDNNVGIGYQSGSHTNQKTDAKNQILIGAGTYGTRDSITVLGADFIKETIVRGKLIDSTLSAGSGTKAVRWDSSTGEFTYADTTAGGGGGSPAGSNRQVQYNNSGAFGGATGVEIGNTNERLTVTSQATSEAALTVKQVGQYVGINIKPSDASTPYSPLLSFSQTINSVGARMGLDAGIFRIEGGFNPYGFQNQEEVAFGSFYSGVSNFRVHTYVADVPASPDDWTIRVRTPKTAAVGQVIDWGAAGQTGDLLQFRNNSNTVLAKFDSIGNIYSPASNYSTGGFKYLVRNVTTGKFEKQDALAGSGTYTPTTSGLTNVDSTHVFECQYSWITDAESGLKTVTVSGQVEVYINSANTDSRVILSLPVASSFANEYEAGGSGGVTSASNGLSNHRYSIGVNANTISEAAEFVFNPTSGSCNAKINFSFHYKVNTP